MINAWYPYYFLYTCYNYHTTNVGYVVNTTTTIRHSVINVAFEYYSAVETYLQSAFAMLSLPTL